MTVHQLANALAKPSQRELEQKQAREKELQEKANAIAKERSELTKKTEKLLQAEQEEDVIEVGEVEFEDLSEEPFAEAAFQEEVNRYADMLRKEKEHERSGKSFQRTVEAYWEMLTKNQPTDWKKLTAKAVLQFLLKKYPQLMDEGI